MRNEDLNAQLPAEMGSSPSQVVQVVQVVQVAQVDPRLLLWWLHST
jgi:hypothetical protein